MVLLTLLKRPSSRHNGHILATFLHLVIGRLVASYPHSRSPCPLHLPQRSSIWVREPERYCFKCRRVSIRFSIFASWLPTSKQSLSAMAPLTDPYRLSHEAKDLEYPIGKPELDNGPLPRQQDDSVGSTQHPKFEDFAFFASAQRIAERIQDGKRCNHLQKKMGVQPSSFL